MCLIRGLGGSRINVDKGTKPIVHKAKLLLYSIKQKIELELERLVREHIFQSMEYPESI